MTNIIQLKNLQQEIEEHVKLYYEHLLKLANDLQIKATNFFTTSFRTYLRLTMRCMTRDTLINHKKIVITYEKNGLIITNYNVLLTQLYSKPIVQPIINYITTKQPLTCSNCGKTSHAKKTCHNRTKEKHVIHFVPTKVVELIAKQIAQPIKPTRIPLKYPCMICFSSEHRAFTNP
jgi:hypothetical protein